ncbi:polynucleotide adenylyltransferase PcnB [Engelhardtia mirabilis]|uniref:Poly(A) polymerase I n=1 Tax=Engelhardtia mirabilis TaxID=2528011 RepID=A0A518BKL2_9BACT|nr:Poly(A) polymerase I precursor [Planctomycetes bacterium Pla133]QDV01832.1 Poly(A) polymerase I precursor [Planctomycetes bacterium Pla86]
MVGRGERGLRSAGKFDEDQVPRADRDLSGAEVSPADRIPRHKIDQDALRVVSRLYRRGFEAYLVGGCVRDLLVGLEPKDFDVATEAHPRQIKRIFRNGRIIGRRFKLVHVVYGDHIVETSTFRAAPPQSDGDDGDLLIVDDNEFGTAAEDAARRDFTINALFLDPLENKLIDFVGGLEDLERRQLRTIGDPYVRLAEDPVRILRGIKFATRLSFDIEPRTWNAMCDLSQELERSAPPRVVEEILKLLRSAHSAPAFKLLDECGALGVLCPEIADWLEWARSGADDPDYLWRLLTDLDQRTRRGKEPSISLALAVLFAPLAERVLARLETQKAVTDGQIQTALGELLEPIGAPSRLSRRDLGQARRMLANQRRFSQPSSKRFRPLLFMRSPDFEATLELFHLRTEARDEGWDLLESWQQRYRAALEVDDVEVDQIRSKRRRRRRRPRASADD